MQRQLFVWIERWQFFRGFHRLLHQLGRLGQRGPSLLLPSVDHQLPVVTEVIPPNGNAYTPNSAYALTRSRVPPGDARYSILARVGNPGPARLQSANGLQ